MTDAPVGAGEDSPVFTMTKNFTADDLRLPRRRDYALLGQSTDDTLVSSDHAPAEPLKNGDTVTITATVEFS